MKPLKQMNLIFQDGALKQKPRLENLGGVKETYDTMVGWNGRGA
jgi:hypothetical protein